MGSTGFDDAIRLCEWCCFPIEGEARSCPVWTEDGVRAVRYWHADKTHCSAWGGS